MNEDGLIRAAIVAITAVLCLQIALAAPSADGAEGSSMEGGSESAFLDAVLGMIRDGDPSMTPEEISIGESMTRLVCRCIEDGSCDDFVSTLCEPLEVAASVSPGLAEGFLTPLTDAASDPSAAICALGHYGFGSQAPVGVSRWERPEGFAVDPVLSIEAVRWLDEGRYHYAIRYHLVADEDFDAYDGIDLEARTPSSRRVDLISHAGVPSVGSQEDFPLALSFSHDDLLSRTCISFSSAPQGIPDEYCTGIVEVRP